MTLVAAWRGESGITVAADTRIVSPGSTGGVISLTDQGPKIFACPVVVSQTKGNQTRVRQYPPIGFAFAGETLIAGAVHAMVSTCLQNLSGNIAGHGPSIDEIADLYARCSLLYLTEMAALRGRPSAFTAFIFGYCSRSREVSLCTLSASYIDDAPHAVAERQDLPRGDALSIGSGAMLFQKISHEQQAKSDRVTQFDCFELALRSGAVASVGGSRQYAEVTQQGAFLRPAIIFSPDEKFARVEVLGCDISDLGAVGPCSIGHIVVGPSEKSQFYPK